jgi:CrcB protein
VPGSASIGLFGGLLAIGRIAASEHVRTFATVGLLGGFTTFSSFSLHTLALYRGRQYGLALFNAAGQVVIGFLAAWAGFRMGAAGPPSL